MSVHVMVAVFDAEGLTSTEKLVALAYAEHGHDDGSEARAGIDRICRYTALSRRTVQTTLHSLVSKGVVKVEREATNKNPTWYRFLLTPDGKSLIMSRGAAVAPQEEVVRGATDASRGETDDALGRSTRTQTVRTVKEPSLTSVNDYYPEPFEMLWKTYPRKKEKVKAYRVVKALIRKGVTYKDLQFAAERYAQAKVDTDEKFIKLPATFFGPDAHWREWVDTPVDPTAERSDDWEDEIKRRQAESVPPPSDFAKSIRKQMMGGDNGVG